MQILSLRLSIDFDILCPCVMIILYGGFKRLFDPDSKANLLFVAFILYRQHYQAQVVSQHPGLANPEISKIIGEQWREQAPEIKNDWKRLAEVSHAH